MTVTKTNSVRILTIHFITYKISVRTINKKKKIIFNQLYIYVKYVELFGDKFRLARSGKLIKTLLIIS